MNRTFGADIQIFQAPRREPPRTSWTGGRFEKSSRIPSGHIPIYFRETSNLHSTLPRDTKVFHYSGRIEGLVPGDKYSWWTTLKPHSMYGAKYLFTTTLGELAETAVTIFHDETAVLDDSAPQESISLQVEMKPEFRSRLPFEPSKRETIYGRYGQPVRYEYESEGSIIDTAGFYLCRRDTHSARILLELIRADEKRPGILRKLLSPDYIEEFGDIRELTG